MIFALLGACLLPIALMVGGFTSGSELAVRTASPFISPKDTTGTMYSYSTTSYNDNGVAVPATAYEPRCVASEGGIVKEDPILFAFIWVGVAALAALTVIALLALALAALAGVLANKLFKSRAESKN